MKYWVKRYHKYMRSDVKTAITLEVSNRIIIISLLKNGDIRFEEGCDEYFYKDLKKDEALKLINELKELIENDLRFRKVKHLTK